MVFSSLKNAVATGICIAGVFVINLNTMSCREPGTEDVGGLGPGTRNVVLSEPKPQSTTHPAQRDARVMTAAAIDVPNMDCTIMLVRSNPMTELSPPGKYLPATEATATTTATASATHTRLCI
jgi:hypothetical protein